jgi:hypothetical protein
MPQLSSEALARLLPDLPRWVEVRSMLLRGHGFAVGVAAARVREVLAAPEDADWVASALPRWSREPATIHTLESDARLPTVPSGIVREVHARELEAVADRSLRDELLSEAADGTRIVAAYADEIPVAFCYAGSVTEQWWDISIDTLEPYRRMGYAALCGESHMGDGARGQAARLGSGRIERGLARAGRETRLPRGRYAVRLLALSVHFLRCL